MNHILSMTVAVVICISVVSWNALGAQAISAHLFNAISSGDFKQVNGVLAAGADVNAKGPQGKTPLMIASEAGNVEILKLLLTRNPALNAKDEKGFTALMLAAKSGHLEIVRLLVAAGADQNLKTNAGFTAMEVAAAYDHHEVARLLGGEAQAEAAEQASGIAEADAIAEVTGVDRKKKCLAIRSAPRPDAKELGCLRLGERVGLTDTWTNNNWILLSSPVAGWVPGEMLRLVSQSPSGPTAETAAPRRQDQETRRPQAMEQPSRHEPVYRQEQGGEEEYYEEDQRPTPPHGSGSWWRR
jgi:hypothetical protein